MMEADGEGKLARFGGARSPSLLQVPLPSPALALGPAAVQSVGTTHKHAGSHSSPLLQEAPGQGCTGHTPHAGARHAPSGSPNPHLRNSWESPPPGPLPLSALTKQGSNGQSSHSPKPLEPGPWELPAEPTTEGFLEEGDQP